MSSDFRKDFKFFSEYPDLVYFDNAATTQKPDVVLEKMVKYYESENANPLRGVYDLSVKATTVYEDARERTARFIGASSPSEIVFTRNATESLNLIARSYGEAFIKEGEDIVLTVMEHHSNLLPWQETARRTGANLVFLTPDKTGFISDSGKDYVKDSTCKPCTYFKCAWKKESCGKGDKGSSRSWSGCGCRRSSGSTSYEGKCNRA